MDPFPPIFLTTLGKHIVRAVFILLATTIVVPAIAQNTKGDRPVSNQRTVRETKGKTVKKKSKATTRDIAGRRLRTKNKSSANRANVGIPQPATTSRQPRRVRDTPAPEPANKRFASKERRRSDPDRSWHGDISGYKPRKIKPASAEETGRNVYPQREYMTRRPMGDRPFKQTETHTSSGKKIIKRTPNRTERAWKGDIKGQPFSSPRSRTGELNNSYRKNDKNPYLSKRPAGKDRSFDNQAKISKAKRLGTDTTPKRWGNAGMGSPGQGPFVTRGRKNVYWGKTKITERAKLGDLLGRPLRMKNFRSKGTGFIGTDTLAFFGRKPHGDVSGQGRQRNGKFLPGSESKGGWSNDIAGWRLRKKLPGHERPGSHDYSGFRSVSGKFNRNKPLQGKAPGIGAGAIAGSLKKTRGNDGRIYGDQGGGFSGYLKSKRPSKFTGSKTGALWNNNRTPIGGKILPGSAGAAGRFSGRDRDNGQNYNDQGGAFTGYLKARKPFKFTGSKSGGLWNNNRTPIGGKILPGDAGAAGRFPGRDRDNGQNYNDQGGAFTGYLKAKKPYKFTGNSSGKPWNNDGNAVQGKLLPGGADRAGRFSGNIRGTSQKDLSDQGSGFTGYLKAKKPHKFTGSLSGNLWNNDGKATTQINASRADAAAGSFQGRKKIRGQEKGKMLLIPNKLWNNNETPVTQLETTRAAAKAGYYQGGKKTREPEKSKIMSTPNVLWNNEGKATTQVRSTKAGMAAGAFQGRHKAKEQEKYPLNSNHTFWNNDGKATTQVKLSSSAAAAGGFHGNVKYKKDSKDRDSDIQSRMKMKRDYTQNPHSVDEATKKQKPELNRRANTYVSGVKVVGKRKHHPNSDDEALDGLYVASARKTDYQGNVKMKKFFERHGESPDAKFVNQGENNVKEDRTIVTNVKLFWTKLFQKSESQPSNLKERSSKMRYDKGEKGMWAD